MLFRRSRRASVQALVVNAGSSSLRLSIHEIGDSPQECIEHAHLSSRPAASPSVLAHFQALSTKQRPEVVVHRVVHGGHQLPGVCWVNGDVRAEITRLNPMAPLHNGLALDWIDAAEQAFGTETPQVACFDTGFYRNLPQEAAQYPLPNDILERHQVRRYGFHGLAHQSMLQALQRTLGGDELGRVLSIQLGAGCSATASINGQPVDTSMGFSPLEGLMMATRCGDLDAAAALYLVTECGMDPGQLLRLLNESSGLLGVSAQSSDMKALLETDSQSAHLAVSMYCHRARQYIGAYLATLGGADAIVFGGGVAEGSPEIRARLLERLEWAGVQMDSAKNASLIAAGGLIHGKGSSVKIAVCPVDEAALMASEAGKLIRTEVLVTESRK